MNILISEDTIKKNFDFNNIKNNKHLSDPISRKKLAIRNARGSSFIEGINLPEEFYIKSYELEDLRSS